MQLLKILQLKPIGFPPPPTILDTIPDTMPESQPVHTHQWLQEAISYAPPRRDLSTLNVPQELYRELALGVTTIIDKCQICSDTKKVEFLGSQNPQLDDLLDKTDLYGPQYLQKNGITYLIQKFVPQHPGQLPIR